MPRTLRHHSEPDLYEAPDGSIPRKTETDECGKVPGYFVSAEAKSGEHALFATVTW